MITLKNYIHTSTLLFVILFAHISPTFAQPEPTLAWAKTINSTGSSYGGLVTSDDEGNTYVLGVLNNTSLTIGVTTVSATNSKAILIKYDSAGDGIWIREIPFIFLTFTNTHPHKFLSHNDKLYLFV